MCDCLPTVANNIPPKSTEKEEQMPKYNGSEGCAPFLAGLKLTGSQTEKGVTEKGVTEKGAGISVSSFFSK